MASRVYATVQAGEWRAPRRRGYLTACCDCGLVHRVNYRLHKDPGGGHQIQLQNFRDNRRTANIRRGMKMAEWTDILRAIKKKVGPGKVPVLITIKTKTRTQCRERS